MALERERGSELPEFRVLVKNVVDGLGGDVGVFGFAWGG